VTQSYIVGTGYGLGEDPDPALLEWCFRYARAGGSPSAVAALERMNLEIDTRDVLPAIRVPTLVMNRTGDPVANVNAARDLCSRIPGAKFLEWPGATHGFSDVADQVIPTIEEFVAKTRPPQTSDRFLATILLVNVVDPPRPVTAGNDAARRDLLSRTKEITYLIAASYHGRDVKRTAAGFLAIFDGPARAIQCAKSIQEGLEKLGLDTQAGLHTGECEFVGKEIGGVAVDVAARIAAVAMPGEILISSTVRDLVTWPGVLFEDRGLSSIEGLAHERHLFRVV
jgi:class 3 adenylate cyclase